MITVEEKIDAQKGIQTEKEARVAEFKKRMLAWPNPVEFVNNMYGSHPDDDGGEYFKSVFGK